MSEEDIGTDEELSMLNELIDNIDEGDDDAMLEGEVEMPDLDGVESEEEMKELLADYKEKVHKRNVSLRKAKKAQQRTDTDLQSALAKIEALTQQVGNIQTTKEPDALDLGNWSEKVIEDPTAALEFTQKIVGDLEGRFANSIEQMKNELLGAVKQSDPELIKYRDKIDAMKQLFPEQNDAELLKLAKVLDAKKVNKTRGSISTGKKVVNASKEGVISDDARAKLLAAMGIGE